MLGTRLLVGIPVHVGNRVGCGRETLLVAFGNCRASWGPRYDGKDGDTGSKSVSGSGFHMRVGELLFSQ